MNLVKTSSRKAERKMCLNDRNLHDVQHPQMNGITTNKRKKEIFSDIKCTGQLS